MLKESGKEEVIRWGAHQATILRISITYHSEFGQHEDDILGPHAVSGPSQVGFPHVLMGHRYLADLMHDTKNTVGIPRSRIICPITHRALQGTHPADARRDGATFRT